MCKAMIESLEGRRLLAGDVSVVPTAAEDNVIIGDDESNAVIIEPDGAGGIQARGIDGTTINGDTDPVPVIFLNTLLIQLDAGDDELIIESIEIEVGSLSQGWSVSGGDGDDSVLIRSGGQSIGFDGGLGDDWLGIYDVTVGRISANGGGGRDTFEVRRTTVRGFAPGTDGTLTWNDRSGPGGIFIEDTTVDGTTAIASVDASAAFPVWAQLLNNTFTGPAALATGNGDDTLLFRGNTFGDGDLDLFTGEGDDEIVRE